MISSHFIEVSREYLPQKHRNTVSRYPFLPFETTDGVMLYRKTNRRLSEGGVMQLAVFAVQEAKASDLMVHTIESMPEWPNPTYERFSLDEVRVEARRGELHLPARLYRPELEVHIGQRAVMMLQTGMLRPPVAELEGVF